MDPKDFEDAEQKPAASVKMDIKDGNMRVEHSYEVKTPPKDMKDFIVSIKASDIKKWRKKLSDLNKNIVSWKEILLGVCFTGVGVIASALIGGKKLSDPDSIYYLVITPLVTLGTGISYFFVKDKEISSVDSISKELLEEIPNIEEMVGNER